MHAQASMTKAKMELCTCVYGFLRVCEAVPGPFGKILLSPNYMVQYQGSDEFRTNPAVNGEFTERVFYFLLYAVIKSYGPTILPPNHPFGFVSAISTTPQFTVSSCLSHARSRLVKWRAELLAMASEFFLKLQGRKALANLGAFRATFTGGLFHKSSCRQAEFPILNIYIINNSIIATTIV